MRDGWNMTPLLPTMDKRGKFVEIRKTLGRALSRIVCEGKSPQALPFCHDLDKFPLRNNIRKTMTLVIENETFY